MSASAVVFAYHEVGVRCLSVLLAHGVEIPLVVTHHDDPRERIWFGSVERLARDQGLRVEMPHDPNAAAFTREIESLAPDFVFSFYYRQMLSPALLGAAKRGAYNMHGSLLPKYRGRAPVNWAVLHGEIDTGATLHRMAAKPDAGAIVDQMAVPILPDDLAIDVFRKVTVASELVLDRTLPQILDGTAKETPQDLAKGSYFVGRRPADGRIDWTHEAGAIHNLVRAVAPPYPGAFTELGGHHLTIHRTRVLEGSAPRQAPRLEVRDDAVVVHCADGGRLQVLEAALDGIVADPPLLLKPFGSRPL
jgi:methionyl-tRNA formyltransferase